MYYKGIYLEWLWDGKNKNSKYKDIKIGISENKNNWDWVETVSGNILIKVETFNTIEEFNKSCEEDKKDKHKYDEYLR